MSFNIRTHKFHLLSVLRVDIESGSIQNPKQSNYNNGKSGFQNRKKIEPLYIVGSSVIVVIFEHAFLNVFIITHAPLSQSLNLTVFVYFAKLNISKLIIYDLGGSLS